MTGLLCLWVQTEGLDHTPILCTAGADAFELASRLSWHKIITEAALVPCCRNDNTACARDQWTAEELATPIAVLRHAAGAHRIQWPDEYSELRHAEG